MISLEQHQQLLNDYTEATKDVNKIISDAVTSNFIRIPTERVTIGFNRLKTVLDRLEILLTTGK